MSKLVDSLRTASVAVLIYTGQMQDMYLEQKLEERDLAVMEQQLKEPGQEVLDQEIPEPTDMGEVVEELKAGEEAEEKAEELIEA